MSNLPIGEVICGDNIEIMKTLPDNSIDACITDPPYGLEFMGKEWDSFDRFGRAGEEGDNDLKVKKNFKILPRFFKSDMHNYQQWCQEWGNELLRILKPGAFLLAFGGTRTHHRLICGIEDAGFEIRDCMMWIYSQGFPKSLNIGKAIDKLQGNNREIVGNYIAPDGNERHNNKEKYDTVDYGIFKTNRIKDKGNSEWEGWGTALKPACEPIVVARKPLSENTVALNVLKWGTGGINIDGTRIGYKNEEDKESARFGTQTDIRGGNYNTNKPSHGDICAKNVLSSNEGRFPSNIIFDEEAGKELDIQTGILKSGYMSPNLHKRDKTMGKYQSPHGIYGKFNNQYLMETYGDIGGASRFFYCAKAGVREKNEGLEELPLRKSELNSGGIGRKCSVEKRTMDNNINALKAKNIHPCVKPIALMEYLVNLVCSKNGIVIDLFSGSGTTAIACGNLGRKYIAIEKEKEYCKISEARLKYWSDVQNNRQKGVVKVESKSKKVIKGDKREKSSDQMELF